MTRILIADDHAIVRKGLVQILTEVPDTYVIDEAGSGEEALDKALNSDYDLVLLDIAMPGTSGLDVLRELNERKPELHVLMLSMHPEEQYALRALRFGASGYLTKGSAPDELVDAIRRVLAGGRYVSSSLAEKLAFGEISGAEKQIHESLSPREHEVMIQIASGNTLSGIARDMSLSAKTVGTFRARLLRKMKMKSNAELTHYVIKNNLLDKES
jgi:two-component system, NarL family, invasion response regulator UvrY